MKALFECSRRPRQNGVSYGSSEMYKPRIPLQYFIVLCWLALCGGTVRAQVPPPLYTFLEVTGESGAPVAGASVVLYNASGEEVRHWVTDDGGKVRIRGHKSGLINEPWLSNDANGGRIVRVIKLGYLTYEGALEGPLTDKLVSEDRGGEAKIKIQLLRRPRSKVGGLRKTQSQSYAQNRPP